MKQSVFLYLLFFALIALVTTQCTNGTPPVNEASEPEELIEFSHDIHAGKNGIDCKYCHNSEFDENNTGIPTTEVCLKCHKQINGKIVSDSIQK